MAEEGSKTLEGDENGLGKERNCAESVDLSFLEGRVEFGKQKLRRTSGKPYPSFPPPALALHMLTTTL